MDRLVGTLILGILSAAFSFGQVPIIRGLDPIQTGFAVVTPLYGGGQGLRVSETFGTRLSGNFVQSSVMPSPLVTLTDIVVNFDRNAGVNTAIAIVNPTVDTARVSLTLRDQQGGIVGIRNIAIEGEQQLSRFASQLFASLQELSGPFEGLLFVSSDVPIGVLGLAFDGPSFTALPVARQLNPNDSITAPFSLVGETALLLAQLATGGGWESRITIANTSTVPQLVRIDFFSSQGGRLTLPIGSSIPAANVPANGVVSFSTISTTSQR
jgi:hypothetical protein